MTAVHRLRYYYEVLHAQSKGEQTLISQNKVTPWLPNHIDFTDNNTKKTSAPRYFETRDSGTFLYPEIFRYLR